MTHIHDRPTHQHKSVSARRVSNLNSSLRQFGPLSQLLPCVDVGVVRALEGPLQLLQLLRREGGPAAALLPLQGQARLGVHVGGLVRVAGWNGTNKKTEQF